MAFSSYQTFSLSVWVKVNNLYNDWRAVLTHGYASGNYYSLWVSDTNSWVGGRRTETFFSNDIDAGVWTHLVFTQDICTRATRFYVDGILFTTALIIDGSGPGELWIGGANDGSQFFDGQISDVRIYPGYPFETADVLKLYGMSRL